MPAGPMPPNGIPPGMQFMPPPGSPLNCCPPPPAPCAPPPQEPIYQDPPISGPLLFSFDVDYLRWYLTKAKMPPLITIGNPNDFQFGVPGTDPGALGLPGTRILLQQFNEDYVHNGARVSMTGWLDPQQILGVQASFFVLARENPSVSAGSDGSAKTFLVARPFFNVNTESEDADPVAIPGSMSGHITVSSPRSMLGAETNLCYNYMASSMTGVRLGLLAGARFLLFDEKLFINQVSTQLPDAFGNPGITDFINDNFSCSNRFLGGQIGLDMEFLLGPVYFEMVGKVALGETNQIVNISGSTVQINPPDPTGFLNQPPSTTTNAGLYAQPSNSGHFSRDQFSVVPEFQFNLGYSINQNLMVRAGYNVMVWTDVVRPGSEINRAINIDQTLGLGGNVPVFAFHPTNMWIQGFQVGLEFSF
jgi:Putative beta barrel porin-7 (BBP7)